MAPPDGRTRPPRGRNREKLRSRSSQMCRSSELPGALMSRGRFFHEDGLIRRNTWQRERPPGAICMEDDDQPLLLEEPVAREREEALWMLM